MKENQKIGVFIGDKKHLSPNISSSPTHKQKNNGTLNAQLNGENISVEIKSSQTVLEALIEAGHSPPYSCMEGACTACLAKVTHGILHQKIEGVLTEENINNNEALTCQACLASNSATVSYDSFFE